MTQDDSITRARMRHAGWKQRNARATEGASHGFDAPGESAAPGFGPHVRMASRLDREEAFEAIVARGPAMQGLLDRAQKAARHDSPLLLFGEPGCGKRAIAKLVHELSARCDMPFVRVDCAAHDAAGFEGELFGVRRGGEVRAVRDREGLVQTAHRGTLLLENVADVPAAVQPKLQEFLASGEFRPVGDRWGTRCADVRVIVSASASLEERVAEGRLRRALYDRLAVLVVQVPSLRERVEDIEPLVEHFIDALHPDESPCRRGRITIDREARAWLRAYPWPGNVRELQNAVEYACVMGAKNEVRSGDLPDAIRRHAAPDGFTANVLRAPTPEEADPPGEHDRIARALAANAGDVDAAARTLGMTRRALRYAMAQLDLEPKREARVPGARLQAVLDRRSSGA